jgi:phosphotransferase system HPr (HPr) family protein
VAIEVLPPSAIVVGATAADRDEAIQIVGRMLVDAGCVTPDYLAEMRDREEIVSTYLGNGIALPHGTNEARTAVLRTGLAVVQFPDGVAWGDERAHLVIGLAATSDDHIAIMARLATVLGDEALCRRLAQTTDAMEIHTVLASGEPMGAPGNGGAAADDELERTLVVANPSGLHARPAASVVDRVRGLDAELAIESNGRRANARSITALLGLGVSTGDSVRLIAHGPEAEAALDAVTQIVTNPGGG